MGSRNCTNCKYFTKLPTDEPCKSCSSDGSEYIFEDLSMDINEIENDIMKNKDNQLARAFTMTIGKMLTSKGIHPIVIKSPEHWVTDDDINSYIIRKEYNVTFDIDTTEHDKEVRKQVIKEIEDAMYHEAFEVSHEEDGLQKWDSGNWIRYKLFENVLDSIRLKDVEV